MDTEDDRRSEVPGTLYIVATPIGNLDDVTLRAIKVLNRVELIAAEDTRRSVKLLNHFHIHCPLVAFHELNKEKQVGYLVGRLLRGDSVALVSDAGTPVVSDPAYLLLRQAIRAGVTVVPVPGVSAAITALMAAGLNINRFTFYGFPPRSAAARRELFGLIGQRPEAAILFEGPHRLVRTLQELANLIPDRPITLAKEMTKLHEAFLRGSAAELLAAFGGRKVQGEFTLVIGGLDADIAPAGDAIPWIDRPEHSAQAMRRHHRKSASRASRHRRS